MTATGTICMPGVGRSFDVAADVLTVKGFSEEDAFSVVEYVAAPGVPGPPPHVHQANEEAFFILEGTIEFLLDGVATTLTQGSFVLVPKGAVHTFTNTGEGPARWVGIFSPGRYLGLVEDLASVMPADGPPDPAAVAEVLARWDSAVVVPAPARP